MNNSPLNCPIQTKLYEFLINSFSYVNILYKCVTVMSIFNNICLFKNDEI